MNNFILKGNICYSISKKELKTLCGYIVCEDGICKGVFEEIPQEYHSFEVIDYSDKLIISGMVDLHIHAPQYAFRGIGMDYELIEWLNTYTFPEEAKYKDIEYAKNAYSIFATNIRKSATTRACIFATQHREATKILMDLMEESGVISFVGKINMDRSAPDSLVEKSADMSALELVELPCAVTSVYNAVDSKDKTIGYAVMVSTGGYGGEILLTVGIDSDLKVTGIDVISHSETPGLGEKCTKSEFKEQFKDKEIGVKVVKKGAQGNQVDAISSATITSKAVTKGVDTALAAVKIIKEAE